MGSKELFNVIKNIQIRFSEIKNKQNNFLKNLNEVKIGKKTYEQKEVIDNLNKFYNSREEVINFFRDYIEMLSDAKQNETKGKQITKTNASKITNSSCTSKSRQ